MKTFLGPVVVTHIPSGRVRSFDHPRDAALFIEECKAKKILPVHLNVDNQSGVSLDAYTDRIPDWAQELIEDLELYYGGNVIKTWHFMKSKKTYRTYSVGRSWYSKRHISITFGTDMVDFKGVIIHEFSHAIAHQKYGSSMSDHHGKKFYNAMFDALRIFCNRVEESIIVARENRYMKSSRFWYAEKYNDVAVLSEYAVAATKAPKPTTKDVVDNLFPDED